MYFSAIDKWLEERTKSLPDGVKMELEKNIFLLYYEVQFRFAFLLHVFF